MKVLFNKLGEEYKKNKKKFEAKIDKVLKSGNFILGKEVENFEKEFARYIGVKYCIGVGNGLEALQLSLMALNIGPGDEVITTPLSAVASALAIKLVGAKPVFVDIDEYFHLDANKIERYISKRTKAILGVHLYGQPFDIEKILKICKKYDLFLIEDCAQAHGAKFKGKKVGSFGDVGCFSFYPTKNLGAFGDGGAIVTNNKKIYEFCKVARNYGQKSLYEHTIIGLNSRLDEIQAAILRVKLAYLDKYNNRRREIATMYKLGLESIRGLKLPSERPHCHHIYHLFVVEAQKRDELKEFLSKKGIITLIHYPQPIHKQPSFKEYNKLKLPIVEKKTKNILSLPIHPLLTNKEIKFVITSIKEFYSKK
ncbi:MAG: DegT/DnrJ/EryC1/StrS family aminotransferase [Candidatus Micrarchaeia archaeon]